MNTAPHLRSEDRPDFERVLDGALRANVIQQALQAPGARLNAEQLRTKALAASGAIAAAAAGEYGHYVELRGRLQEAAAAHHGESGQDGAPGSLGVAARLASEGGAGALPVLTVLVPILAWAAALIFLLLGYGLHTADPHLGFAHSLITAGWVSLAVGAVTMFVGIVGLLLTALRDGSAPPDGQDPGLYAELAAAREVWKAALLDRGMVPFLLEGVAGGPETGPAADRPHPDPAGSADASGIDLVRRRPRLGYSSPGFTSPGPEGIGRDTTRAAQSAASFSSPEYTSPSFSSPDFTSPNYEGPEEASGPPAAESDGTQPGRGDGTRQRPGRREAPGGEPD